MTELGWLIVALVLGESFLGQVASWLNLKALSAEVPPGFESVYDQERYAKSQAYTRERERFGRWPRLLQVVSLLAFWALGGFAWADGVARGFDLPEAVVGTLFFGILMGLMSVLSAPFSIYSTFVIEARYGFNRTTVRTFIVDRLKGLALGLALGAPLLTGTLWLLAWAAPWGWAYAWAAITLFSLAAQYVAPVWLMPLFMKFTPLDEGELRSRLFAYAETVGFPLTDIYVVDGSRRSAKANAFFTGFGKNKRIALFDTLIDSMEVDELLAVLAHEIGHDKRGHIRRGMVFGIAQSAVTFALLGLCLRFGALGAALGIEIPSVHASILVFGLLYTPVDVAVSIFSHSRSRAHEYEADAYAAETTGDGGALIRGLLKLARDSLSNLTPHPFYVWLHHSHPPLTSRVTALGHPSQAAGS